MIKIERTSKVPESLAIEKTKKSGRYDLKDVVDQLISDFYGKCYLCGISKLQDPQIEHLRPHKNGKYLDLKFDWNNLFLSCGHCNSVKNKHKYEEHVLDCCKRDPEDCMVFHLEEGKVIVTSKDSHDIEAITTAELMEEIFGFGSYSTAMRDNKCQLRLNKLMQEMNILYKYLEEYNEDNTSKVNLMMLKALLSRKSPFAEFKRCYVREHGDRYPKLIEYLN